MSVRRRDREGDSLVGEGGEHLPGTCDPVTPILFIELGEYFLLPLVQMVLTS